jgi:hypothetical protein
MVCAEGPQDVGREDVAALRLAAVVLGKCPELKSQRPVVPEVVFSILATPNVTVEPLTLYDSGPVTVIAVFARAADTPVRANTPIRRRF